MNTDAIWMCPKSSYVGNFIHMLVTLEGGTFRDKTRWGHEVVAHDGSNGFIYFLSGEGRDTSAGMLSVTWCADLYPIMMCQESPQQNLEPSKRSSL